MLASQLNYLITDNKMLKNSLICLRKYTCNAVSGKKLIILMGVDVISPDFGAPIGTCEVTFSRGDNI